MVHWLNGGDAKPTMVPPRPFERGVAGRPTLVDNVETLAHLALIARFGAAWWRSMGTSEDPGIVPHDGHRRVEEPGVYEVPYGLPLLTLLDHAEVQAGRACSSAATSARGSRPEVARTVMLSRGGSGGGGASLGCGAVVVLPDDACPLAGAGRVTRWLAGESAGQCGPACSGCRHRRRPRGARRRRTAAGEPPPPSAAGSPMVDRPRRLQAARRRRRGSSRADCRSSPTTSPSTSSDAVPPRGCRARPAGTPTPRSGGDDVPAACS